MSKRFPQVHRVLIEHTWWGHQLAHPVAKYIKSEDFEEWYEEMYEEGYDVYDDGVHEVSVHSPHTTEVWCYPQWKLIKRED